MPKYFDTSLLKRVGEFTSPFLLISFAGIFAFSFGPYVHASSTLSFEFKKEIPYKYSLDEKSNILTLEFQGASSKSLPSLETYDETYIRRILVTDQLPESCTLKIFLKDPSTKIVLNDFQDPFRVTVDFFQQSSEEARDQVTGYPLTQSPDMSIEEPASPIDFATNKMTGDQEGQVSSKKEKLALSANTNKTRRLLQGRPEIVDSPNDLKRSLLELKPGLGPAWASFPPYIYRFQAPEEESPKSKLEQGLETFTATSAIADYAARLYDFGHENRSLLAFQQVLYRDPNVIKKSPAYLWRLAETHLGQGNLTLALGYYQLLTDQHKGSSFSELASLRMLDIAAIRAVSGPAFQDLSEKLSDLSEASDPEMAIQVALRQVYFEASQKGESLDLPEPSMALGVKLASLSEKMPKQKSSFLAKSLALSAYLSDKVRWAPEHARYAKDYFDMFKGPGTEPARSLLQAKFNTRIRTALTDLATKDKDLELISIFEALPEGLGGFSADPKLLWDVAESYRALGQNAKAMVFYSRSAKAATSPADRFKSLMWYAKIVSQKRIDERTGGQAENSARLGDSVRSADRSMLENWSKLSQGEKNQILSSYSDDLEEIMGYQNTLEAPPTILLEAASVKMKDGQPADTTLVFAKEAGRKTHLLKKLSEKFLALGKKQEARQAQNLLKDVRPKDMGEDFDAKNIWAEELAKLADELRQESKYLEAGRLYAMGGSESENWPRQAESLYKGGLLLYRAGRREESLEAFKRCSEDGQNRYYANLCLERLDRLQE